LNEGAVRRPFAWRTKISSKPASSSATPLMQQYAAKAQGRV
jgi:hypothetical protein